MPKVTKIDPKAPRFKRKLRVCGYARVSRDTERLLHSVSAQVSYYSGLIQKNPDWCYVGVYADYGVTGTQVKCRDEFKRMLADCEAGKIDKIITKSISRFGRNTVDVLETVRHLKEIGVEVYFEEQNISTFSGDGELMLTILASYAQEEIRSLSDNVKWGIRKRFKNGGTSRANKHLLGYRYNDEKMRYEIIPDEADLIRRMFDMYVRGIPLHTIADAMNDSGFTGTNGGRFQEASVQQLVHNEVYAGDTLLQKVFVEDPITKRKVKNKGELPQYYVEDTHEAIIDRDTWELVLKEHERRAAMMPPLYCFTGKIVCGKCGMPYTRKAGRVKGTEYVSWICRAKKEVGMTCDNRNFSEDELKKLCAWALGSDEFDEEQFSKEVIGITALSDGSLEFKMFGGVTKVWKNLHVNDTRHIRTRTDAFQGRVFCGKCGRPYHRVCAKNWVYWYCVTKKYGYKGEHCDSMNYTDVALRTVTAFMMGTEEFDERAFEEKVEKIVIEENGGLTYFFKDGRSEKWERR